VISFHFEINRIQIKAGPTGDTHVSDALGRHAGAELGRAGYQKELLGPLPNWFCHLKRRQKRASFLGQEKYWLL